MGCGGWCGDGREQRCLFIGGDPDARGRRGGPARQRGGEGSGGRAVGKGGMVGDADGERQRERDEGSFPVGSFVTHDKDKGKRGD